MNTTNITAAHVASAKMRVVFFTLVERYAVVSLPNIITAHKRERILCAKMESILPESTK